jgi:hypothetical protein
MTIGLWIIAAALILITLPGTIELLWLTTGAVLSRIAEKRSHKDK